VPAGGQARPRHNGYLRCAAGKAGQPADTSSRHRVNQHRDMLIAVSLVADGGGGGTAAAQYRHDCT